MGRPIKPRQCSCPNREEHEAIFKPAGIPLHELEKTNLFMDELEALHLCDSEGMTQEQAGSCMGISRGTVQRLLSEGRRKIVTALVKKGAVVISAR